MNQRAALAVDALADCSFPLAEDYAAEFLRGAEGGGPQSAIRVPWLPLLRRRVTLTFGLHAGVPGGGAPHDEVRFRWSSGTPLLPDFRGTIRFRAESGKTRVAVEGGYDVPLGLAGTLFDRTLGRRMALASLQELAGRIAEHLSARERAWRAAHPAPG